MRLIRVRPCDGVCCEESPRFPNADRSDCIYHDTSGGKESEGCMLMRGAAPIPRGSEQRYQETCVEWPHNMPERNTGNCCWQWAE